MSDRGEFGLSGHFHGVGVFSPGRVTEGEAKRLDRFVESVRKNNRRLEALERGIDRFPAVVTAIDRGYNPPRYSWTEQSFDKNGQRMIKPAGRFGTATASPAFAYGDGSHLPTADLPMPVTMTRRCVVDTLGPVYEFNVYCGCLAGSGSGVGGTVLVPCCPNPIPRTLHGTFSAPTIPCLDGIVMSMIYTSSSAFGLSGWVGGLPANTCVQAGISQFVSFGLVCIPAYPTGQFAMNVSSVTSGSVFLYACLPTIPSRTSASCDPVLMTFEGTLETAFGFAACPDAGEPYTLTITE